MAKDPKVTHPEYVDFNSEEDDLLGDDDLLIDNSSKLIMLIKIKRMTMIRRRLSIY